VPQNTINAGLDTLTSIENLLGSDFNDTLTGDTGNNVLEGGLGNDTLNGGLGNDTLDGGGDRYRQLCRRHGRGDGHPGNRRAAEHVNAGLDTLISIENLLGSSFNDALIGNTGDNALQGGSGNDTLNGGLGNDTLDGGSGTDTASYAGAAAGVTVTLASSAQQNTDRCRSRHPDQYREPRRQQLQRRADRQHRSQRTCRAGSATTPSTGVWATTRSMAARGPIPPAMPGRPPE
jgi:hypothetical protein